MPKRSTSNDLQIVVTGQAERSSSALPVTTVTENQYDVREHAGLIRARRFAVPVLFTLFLTTLLITFPRLPLGVNDDSSWAAVLGYGHQKGLQFGRDLVFTYGPLGFLVTPYFCPQAPVLRLFTDGAVSSMVVIGICLLAWRLTIWWRVLFLGIFAFIASNCDPRTELLLYLGLFSWGMLCLLELKRPAGYLAGLAVLAIFSALAKVTFLFLAGFTLLVVATELLLRGRRRLALGFLAGCALGGLLAWIAAGQHLVNIGPFITNALAISLGYEQAMATEDFPVLTWSAVLMLTLTLAVIVLRFFGPATRDSKGARWRNGLQMAWFAGLAFLIWKHGFIRAGRDHTEIFLGFIPTMAVALAALPTRSRVATWLAGVSAVVCCLIALFALQWLFAGAIRSCLAKPFELLAAHTRIFATPGAYWSNINNLQKMESDAAQLPRLREKIGTSSVDVYGFNQAYAVFNGFNFHPRPVFQSYAAFSQRLMQLNERFYSSDSAPDYVLFRLDPIDKRFPPLEDALVFQRLLSDYEPVDAEGPFLLLKAGQQTAPQLQLLTERVVHRGELVDLREWQGANLWLSLGVQRSFLGRVRSFFYQGPKLELGVWVVSDGRLKMAKFDASAPILEAGFLANPLQLENQDVLDLYTGKRVARAVAYSVEFPPGAQPFWESVIHFKIFKVQSRLGKSAPRELDRLLSFPGFEATPEKVVAPETKILSVGGNPAVALVGGGSLQFRIPPDAKFVTGNFGYAAAAYLLGGTTEGAEFRIEEQLADGSLQLLYSQTLKPVTEIDDRGMKPFKIACSGTGDRHLFLRALPLSGANPARELTCWAGVGFE